MEGLLGGGIELEIEAFDRPGAVACGDDAPSLVVTKDDAIVDVIALEAPARAIAWVDVHTLVVLDAGGHVSFWSLRDRDCRLRTP